MKWWIWSLLYYFLIFVKRVNKTLVLNIPCLFGWSFAFVLVYIVYNAGFMKYFFLFIALNFWGIVLVLSRMVLSMMKKFRLIRDCLTSMLPRSLSYYSFANSLCFHNWAGINIQMVVKICKTRFTWIRLLDSRFAQNVSKIAENRP